MPERSSPQRGRPTKAQQRERAMARIITSAPGAADYLGAVSRGDIVGEKMRCATCQYILNQACGSPVPAVGSTEPRKVVIEWVNPPPLPPVPPLKAIEQGVECTIIEGTFDEVAVSGGGKEGTTPPSETPLP